MTKTNVIIISLLAIVLGAVTANAHTPKNRDFGFGLILGEPSGVSLIFKADADENLHLYAGNSYFGKAKIGADYQWYFDAFNSQIVNLYAGAGAFIGLGEGNGLFDRRREDDDVEGIGIGGRGVMGINILPRNTPLEIFVELGLDAALIPTDFFQPTGALGFRFYP